ncbi:hypothetical protein ACFGXM_00855 [Pasteurella multocida]|uniref:hypothetical protein n=1 Tax=Pasteurella multocida TaxID=747 RepID=UPI002B494D53|nr:hypothetical protein [Pasteurella multocida]WRK07720.1 hypothetical protein RFF38_02505 [Pasteurella multocida]HDR1867389.1 hypothetical protein [Pasteurella multocida]HDR1870579.1 hypothetical protein [Pasteurella multocida]
MKRTSDHSYENIQSALQALISKTESVQDIAGRYGMGTRTLYTYFQRMCAGQPIRGVHSRRGTSALFRVDEHGQVQFEITPSTKKVRGNATMNEIMEQLERIDVKLSALTECVNQLKTLQMEG